MKTRQQIIEEILAEGGHTCKFVVVCPQYLSAQDGAELLSAMGLSFSPVEASYFTEVMENFGTVVASRVAARAGKVSKEDVRRAVAELLAM